MTKADIVNEITKKTGIDKTTVLTRKGFYTGGFKQGTK